MAAEAPSAVLFAGGHVNVNGNSVSGSASVFDGDVIQTKSASAVTLTANGSSVVVPENSSVVYSHGSVNVASGSAIVRTNHGMTAHVGSVTVSPASDSARFMVQQNGNHVEIASLEGSVAITGAGKNVSLEAGHNVTMAMNQEPQTPPAATSGGTTTTTAGAGGAGSGAGIGTTAIVVAVGAAAAAAIAAVVVTRSSSHASASAP